MHEDHASRPIALIGIMGAGKSSMAVRLAGRLGVSFVDTDSSVVKRIGLEIAQIFSMQGEDGFRRLESKALREAVEGGPAVIACGGGIVESPENIELLTRCTVVYLCVSAPTAAMRCGDGAGRPKLGTDIDSSIARLLETRGPKYEQVADFIVDAEPSPEEVLISLMQTVSQ